MNHVVRSGSSAADPAALYGADYYASHCGRIPYDRSEPVWAKLFGGIADDLIRTFQPKRVFDAGCAHGFLVEALRDRGVEAWGRDISSFAISQVRSDVRPYCSVGSLGDPIPGPFDLIVCIEVLEHMPEADGMKAIANFARATDRVVFSSSPNDFAESTHLNVRSGLYWMRAFAAQGFAPDPDADLSFLTAYAVTFTKAPVPSADELEAYAETVHNRHLAHLESEIGRLQGDISDLKSSTSWRVTAPLRWLSESVRGRRRGRR